MGLNWDTVTDMVEVNDNSPSLLTRKDVFRHIATIGRTIGDYDISVQDVSEVYDNLKKTRGRTMASMSTAGNPNRTAYIISQLNSVWRLLSEVRE